MSSTWDVVVIGGGLAGLCAAIAARRAGVSVRLLECAPSAFRGGNARHARNFRVVHEAPTRYVPDAYQAREFLDDLARVTQGDSNPCLAQRLVAESETIAAWLMANGVPLQQPNVGVVPYSRRTVFPLGGGKAMINALYSTATDIGVAISTDSEARLSRQSSNGNWSIDLTTATSSPSSIDARTIVVCAGGAGADPAWLRSHYGDAADGFMVRGTPYANGRMLADLIAAGAGTVGDPTICHMVAVDARGPRFDGGIVTRITAIPYGMVVDGSARRIDATGAGAEPTHYARWGPRIAACAGQTAYLILDADGLQRAAPQAFPPISGATIADLAEALGLDPATLAQSVNAFNAALPAGAHPIASATFAAYPMRPGVTFVHHGVAVDDHMRIVWADDRRNDTLFAAGMIMAANVIGRGYLAGLGLTLAAVFGRLAGTEAARHVHG
ncbi:FAD-dependent tricarballylate dehydrogenase TcuA [Rhodopseudomonas palustris]|uniref:FAD-dependent tricarballylate dehydrogenase TcuA n=1 Tax=Rhodopseudomonas palustris TaxID=1076 RepID=UPI002ACDA4CE|nr:FAD-dependent tricarballylate dehydrogenase TcuA [Rhodopseudomonas palustris]WQH00445.1 FAD-dependent tricarballylate dehydrogenase TcuA [Rhodopseudomonas palustris]